MNISITQGSEYVLIRVHDHKNREVCRTRVIKDEPLEGLDVSLGPLTGSDRVRVSCDGDSKILRVLSMNASPSEFYLEDPEPGVKP